nr:class I SAM-dependent methyltransferase [Mycolicibacterium psychrotolerans]
MSEKPLPVNHHADHPGFSGLTGSLCAWLFLLMGRDTARLAADLSGVDTSDVVVDIGSGAGNAARAAARRGARVTGVDPSPTMLRVARRATRGLPVLTWAQGSAESLPVPDGSATVVWALATVHHWRDVDAALPEILRVLALGGRLLALERRVEPGATGFASHGWTAQQAESFAALCRSAGMVDVRVTEHRAGRRDLWAVSGYRGPASVR